jgi:hypothetical protein
VRTAARAIDTGQIDTKSEESARSAMNMNVGFGSEADMCSAKRHIHFNPNSDRKSGHVMNFFWTLAARINSLRSASDRRSASGLAENQRFLRETNFSVQKNSINLT